MEEEYLRHLEKKDGILKDIKLNEYGIIIFVGIVCAIFYFMKKLEWILPAIVIGLILFILSQKDNQPKINWGAAEGIIRERVNQNRKEGNSTFPDGKIVMSPKGYFIPYGDQQLFSINFCIIEPDGFLNHFRGKVRLDGMFAGIEEIRGDTSGKAPINYGETKWNKK